MALIAAAPPEFVKNAHRVWDKAAGDTAFLKKFQNPTAYAAYCVETYFKALEKKSS